ncbi:MAG: serine--tRNA ligase [Alphaproteobacteria bacterium]|nr:serine--tRNA ligase [Alphaproteobacteria bacterium]
MLDRNVVAESPEIVRQSLQARHASDELLGLLDRLVDVIARRRELTARTDELRAERNRMTKEIGPLMKAGRRDEAAPLREQVNALGAELDGLEEERKGLEAEEQLALLSLPNLVDARVPPGPDEAHNVEVRRWGTPPTLDFDPKDHVALGEALGIMDLERAAKLSGARFPVLVGDGARLERALVNFFLEEAAKAGYVEHIVPYIVSRQTMTGTGQLPKFEPDLFRLDAQVNGEDAFLIPTAEVPLTNLHAGEILDGAALPIRYTAFTPCFRSEAGSYGRDTRGLMRQHQFHKVELVQLTTAEQGPAQHEEMTAHAAGLLEKLGLPYRVQLLCGGDMGFSARICYDLEVWLPGQQSYREISSISWCGGFQGRRMGLRHRPEGGGKPQTTHTLNGSGLAVGRTLIAVLENHQQADGSIVVPEALRPYMGGQERITAR